jgi:hypothetical protein
VRIERRKTNLCRRRIGRFWPKCKRNKRGEPQLPSLGKQPR